MGDAKRERQRQGRQARIAAEQAAKRRAARQRMAIIGGAVFAVLAAVVLIVNRDDGGDTLDSASSSTSVATTESTDGTTATASTLPPESAAGEPCVARTGDLPEGAPEVEVVEGPPPTELVTEDLVVGDGATVPEGATVTIHYVGVACSTGEIFDSSYPGDPPTFPLENLIPGWQQGIPGMNVGGQRLLAIPPGLAYGDAGQQPVISPGETLWFVVEMLDVVEDGT